MNKLAIICSEFNKSLVEKLYQKAVEEFKDLQGLKGSKKPDQLQSYWVPGAGEIPLATKWAIEKQQATAVLALGLVIRGQTVHFDFLKEFLQNALWSLQNQYSRPVVFCVLLVENREQALARMARAKSDMQSLMKMLELQKTM